MSSVPTRNCWQAPRNSVCATLAGNEQGTRERFDIIAGLDFRVNEQSFWERLNGITL
jgi:hypothetical protein